MSTPVAQFPALHRPRLRVGVVALLVVALTAAGAAREWAGNRRAAIAPIGGAGATGAAAEGRATLGQLNSFTLALLLGGLRGPLVMALWSSSESQRTLGEMEDFDTKIELIRLLQPQFATVHLYQIWNKAYNVSAQLSSLPGKYAAILDAVDYARRVLAERPANIDIETQLGEIFNNKLGSTQEGHYYAARVREETQADEPAVRIRFPAARENAFRAAALAGGVSPRRLLVRRTDDPSLVEAAVARSIAEKLQPLFEGPDVSFTPLGSRQVGARGVSGPLRLEPMLDAQGNFLPELVRPRRPAAPSAEPDTYLDGSPAQFLAGLAPFPDGLSPHALAYNHFMKAYVLQTHAGQRHVNRSETFVHANPGRALRDWAFAEYDQGRLLEAEALGQRPQPPGLVGELQYALELASADAPLDAPPPSPELYAQATERYERSQQVGRLAADWLERHIDRYPEDAPTFMATIRRLRDWQVLLEADLAYARLVTGTTLDRAADRRLALQGYAEAYGRLLNYVLHYHAPAELLAAPLTARNLMSQPLETKWAVFEMLLRERDARGELFDQGRAITEFHGHFTRIRARLDQLRAEEAAGR